MRASSEVEHRSLSTRRDVEDAFAQVPSSLAVVAARLDRRPVGMVISSLTAGISFDPPRAVASVRSESRTWASLRGARRLGISLLAEEQIGAVRQLSSRSADRFAGLATVDGPDGAVFLRHAAHWLEAEIETEAEVGDHRLVLLRVLGASTRRGARPAVYWQRAAHRLEDASGPAVTRGGGRRPGCQVRLTASTAST